jgi:hypothetical protein
MELKLPTSRLLAVQREEGEGGLEMRTGWKEWPSSFA